MGVKRTPCPQRRKRENRLAISYPHRSLTDRTARGPVGAVTQRACPTSIFSEMYTARLRTGGGRLGTLAWPFRHIRWKIVLPYAFLTVVLAAAGSYVATHLVTGSLAERFDNQLAEAGRVVADAVVRKERDHLETVRAVAFTEGVPEAVQGADQATLAKLVEPIAANDKVERLEILGAAGQRLKAFSLTNANTLVYEELSDSDNPAAWPLVQKAVRGEADHLGDKYAQIVATSDGFVLYTSGPIISGGKVVGAVLVGTTLDSFVKQTKAAALADVTVYDFDGRSLASTFAQPDEASAAEARLDVGAEVLDDATAGITTREGRTLWGRDYDLVYGRLQVRDQAVGLYSAGLPTDFMFSAGTATRTRVALLFGVGMARYWASACSWPTASRSRSCTWCARPAWSPPAT